MNRPRNRQPRPPRRGIPAPRSSSAVPSTALVVPGARVLVVLKADQPTGRETRGVVQDVLTAGNHPRGIKVRLRDGQVGRVQRMDGGPGADTGSQTHESVRYTHASTDVRGDGYEHLEGPPERNLADYIVGLPAGPSNNSGRGEVGDEPALMGSPGDAVVCPICEVFEGDEVAVSYHVEREHLE